MSAKFSEGQGQMFKVNLKYSMYFWSIYISTYTYFGLYSTFFITLFLIWPIGLICDNRLTYSIYYRKFKWHHIVHKYITVVRLANYQELLYLRCQCGRMGLFTIILFVYSILKFVSKSSYNHSKIHLPLSWFNEIVVKYICLKTVHFW